MIKDKISKTHDIINTIQKEIATINDKYRSGPDLYFYKKALFLREGATNIRSYLSSEYNLEILYATLLAWDMNSRGAKMKYFDDFCTSICTCLDGFIRLEDQLIRNAEDLFKVREILRGLYEKLHLMKTGGKLVSNAKFLHYLFPDFLMPMDRQNTLQYFYGNTNESIYKYMEIMDFSFEILRDRTKVEIHLDNEWNRSVPKLIDNAIILLVGKSVKE